MRDETLLSILKHLKNIYIHRYTRIVNVNVTVKNLQQNSARFVRLTRFQKYFILLKRLTTKNIC